MLRNLLVIVVFLITLGAGWVLYSRNSSRTINITSPIAPSPTPLIKYSFENLRNRTYEGSEIKLGKVIKEEEKYTSYLFSFFTDGKKVTGQLNLPHGRGPFPVVVMLRGYADREIYFTGLGTRKAAGVFAENGYMDIKSEVKPQSGTDSAEEDTHVRIYE